MSVLKTTQTTVSLIALAVLFVALVVLSNNLLRGDRIDLTANHLYTLSPGSKDILHKLGEPINLYFFFSDKTTRNVPALRTYASRVKELLTEYVLASNGKLKLHIIDPEPFSKAEDRATQFGLQAVPAGPDQEKIYFGLAGTNSTDGVETIPFFQPSKEALLEYDVSKLIYTLAHPKKPVIGLLSTLPMNGGFNPMTRQPEPQWTIAQQMSQLFDVRNLGTDVTKINPDIDVLMIVQPKNLSAQTRYAIDQFILGGGRALIFVDPYAEADRGDQRNPQAAMFGPKASDLPQLFKSWGIDYDKNKFIGDRLYALQVSMGADQPPQRHLGIIGLDHQAMSGDDVITAELSSINMAFAGYFSKAKGAKITLTPLLESSQYAMPIDASKARFLRDPSELQKGFKPTGKHYILAARIHGEVPTAFPDGPPKAKSDKDSTGKAGAKDKSDPAAAAKTDAKQPAPLAKSKGPINVILVADTDLLTDRLWVRSTNFFGQHLTSAWANNGDFVINALDNLSGNSDLLSLRGRATSNRPFIKVQQLQQTADAQFRAKQQDLQSELQKAQQRLNELQRQRGQAAQNNKQLILSPAQRKEVEHLRQRVLQVREQLRQVQRDLNRDIERLGDWMKFINIALMPIIVAFIGLLVALVLRSRRRAARH